MRGCCAPHEVRLSSAAEAWRRPPLSRVRLVVQLAPPLTYLLNWIRGKGASLGLTVCIQPDKTAMWQYTIVSTGIRWKVRQLYDYACRVFGLNPQVLKHRK